MDDEAKVKILNGAKEAFFAAMLAGYAGSGAGSIKTKTSSGRITITFEHKEYIVVDCYYVTPRSDCSAGTTTILYDGVPVWWMSYAGSYKKEAIPFLKEALSDAYKVKVFNGGRGRIEYSSEKFIYQNFCVSTDQDTLEGSFEGAERIFSKPSKKPGEEGTNLLGTHKYWGMSLL